MENDYSIKLKTMPSLLSLYRKIFFGRKPGWDKQPLPRIYVSCSNVILSRDKVAQYSSVCSFDFDDKTLPITYMYVIVFRLHAVVFTHDGITFPLLGMIHLKNSISQYRVLNIDEKFDIECTLMNSTVTDLGLEFDLVSKVFVDRKLVWESSSIYLYRIENGKRRVRPPKANTMAWNSPHVWSLANDLGRRYAKASGDYNLIHLHPVLSKRFGFDRVLAHGMWSKARCIAHMMPQIGKCPCKVEVVFKLPLLMPADVSFDSEADEGNLVFELRDKRGRRPYLSGKISFL